MGIIRRLPWPHRKKDKVSHRESKGRANEIVLFAVPLDVYPDDGNKDAEQKFWERMRQMNMPRLV